MNLIPTAPDLRFGNPLFDALAGSGLLPPGQLRQLTARYAAWAQSPRLDIAGQLADRLIEAGLLTRYQAEQLLAGAGRQLRLGQYRILEPIGAGGMGQVFKAEHQLMQRLVALKLLNRQTGEAGDAGFLREIRAAGRLHHPNIVTAFDADSHEGRLYLVMEYIPGVDLGRLVARGGPLPVVLACEYIRQAAVGLQHAFEQGLLHRDIKPTNLLVHNHHYPDTWPPRSPIVVKLLDLGLACLATTEAGAGALAGTPEYMAPERARDSRLLDVRSDLYSLGCTFFYLLTGRTPFRGANWTATLVAHQDEPVPSPAEVRADLPLDVCGKVVRLLAKGIEDRYETPGELADDLENWLTNHAQQWLGTSADKPVEHAAPTVLNLSTATATERESAPLVYPPPQGRGWLALAAVTILGVLVVAGYQWLPRRVQPLEESSPALELERGGRDRVRIQGRSERYGSLARAIAAARDGDTIEIPGGQTIITPPLAWSGKTLTLRAGPGERPRLLLAAEHAAEFWESLLSTDRALTLEGLELGHEPGPTDQRARAHLLSLRGPRLALINCRLIAPESTAVIACRQGGEIDMHQCEVQAQATALSVELTGGVSCAVRVRATHIQVKEPTATALAIWTSGTTAAVPLRITLEENDFDTGRALSLTALPGTIELVAHNNRFRCRQALLSLAAWPPRERWQQRIRWRGVNNDCNAPARNVLVDGLLDEAALGDDKPRS